MTEQNTPKMTHDEMIDTLKGMVFGTFDRTTPRERDALNMAIETLEQEPKTGHWINICDKDFHDYRTGNKLCFECSECRSEYTYKYNYCPNCGARMVEPQESEIHFNCTDAEIAKSFIEDVEAVKDLLP